MLYHRYLPVSLPTVQAQAAEVVVIGAGVAGLSAALAAAQHNNVLVLSKGAVEETNTRYAQGGIAAAIGPDDSPSLHLADTLSAGTGLCDEPATQTLVQKGPMGIDFLLELGAHFDRQRDGRLALTREGAHTRFRILHAGGDATGEEIRRTLASAVQKHPRIRIQDYAMAMDLIIDGGACAGLWVMDINTNTVQAVFASAVIIATGGCGQTYAHTTNSSVVTGDGLAMAFRAGAELMDMEFVQFHPTALALPGAPRFLISEAVRGEGAVLRNAQGDRFMLDIHEMAELAPRDVVARAIFDQMKKDHTGHVWLDITHQPEEALRHRFPTIFATCLSYGLNISKEPIPVAPAQHYTMGGIRVGLHGDTNVPGLYACGEAACLSVHGGNRLASNSLLDGLVFGRCLGESLGPLDRPAVRDLPYPCTVGQDFGGAVERTEPLLQQSREVAWTQAGIIRDGAGLRQGLSMVDEIAEQLPRVSSPAQVQLHNMVQVSHLILISALYRTESRGGHFRRDYPTRNDEQWRCHTVVARQSEARLAIGSAKVQRLGE